MKHPTILIDTREQRPWTFPEYVPVRLATLGAGDYALEGDTRFAIERKSLDDFIGTVFSGWERFKRELARMAAAGFVARVIVVEADYAHTLFSMGPNGLVPPPHNHPNITPEAVAARIAELTLMGVSVLFCGNAEGAAVQAYHLLMNRNKELRMETLNIRVEKVIYPCEEEDRSKRDAGERKLFYILAIATDTGLNTKAKGELAFRPRENERLTLKGDWTVWNGTRQFKWQDATSDIPVDERSMLRYACELTSGIGPKFEEAIWEMYGKDWRDIEPGKIKGLTMAKVDALRDTIQELETKAEQTAAVAFLLEHHLTLNMANAAFEKWGRNTVPTVRGDCYALCDLPNYGFRDIDADIRQTFGIQDGDPRRVMAAIVYCMRQLTERGDTVVPWYLLFGQLKEKLGRAVPEGFILENLQASVMAGTLRYFMSTQMVSLVTDYAAEETIWNFAEARA